MVEKQILVIGATGLLGKPVADRLKTDGYRVRILARDPQKAQNMFDDTFEIVQGDVRDLDSLKKAMTGCSGVHISVGGPVDQLSAENVAALAPALGVERITYISGATVCEKNRWFHMVAQKLNAEEAIRSCKVAYTIFCPTWPMEMVARFARDGSPFMMGKQPNPVHLFAAEDLARMISNAYREDEAANKRFYAYGPESMTLVEALQRYCQYFHPGVSKVSVMPIWMAKLMGTLTRNEGLKFAANLMGYFDKARETGDAAEANRILGAPAITLQTWMESRRNN